MPQRKTPMTYAKAGVDIDAKSAAIASLVKQLRYRRSGRGRMMDIKGQFTSLIDFGDVALTLCTDGVGTKLLIAEAMNKWDTVGIDCMAMNVNDTICVGAEPIAFVDYIALDRPNPEVTEAIGMGLQAGAKMSDCEIVGGEIAVLPEMVKGVDLSGSCLGFVDKDRIVTGADIEIGDVIIGLPSSGVHSNGMTLARRVLERNGIPLDQKIPGLRGSVGEELLTPTSIYVRQVLKLLEGTQVSGMVDVTGGGLRNFVRLKRDVRFDVSRPLTPQPIFKVLQGLGGIEDREMYQTFNMGMGFAVILREDDAKEATRVLAKGARVVGSVVEGEGVGSSGLDLDYSSY
ncbi:MAG: phosphoribosylformylglycinamidine cyclo-ligase [Methanomassiliicoccales archaeon]|nr:phosphoribosylformylglycinamidine cyclo-ligase [Methanomassiliicoccales archaeon]MDD1755909.1 phosphoribosylformylglycinamidine cyclo-ligase [Methanomassiliicoccales archaeon]